MKWISVEDRLPDDCESALLFISSKIQRVDYDTGEPIGDEREYTETAIGYIEGGKLWIKYDQDGIFDLSEITHWMPLSEPPQ